VREEVRPANRGHEGSRNETNRHGACTRHRDERDASGLPAHRNDHVGSKFLRSRKSVAHLQRISRFDLRGTILEIELVGSFGHQLSRHKCRGRRGLLLRGNGGPQRIGERAVQSGLRCGSPSIRPADGVPASRPAGRLATLSRIPPKAIYCDFAHAGNNSLRGSESVVAIGTPLVAEAAAASEKTPTIPV